MTIKEYSPASPADSFAGTSGHLAPLETILCTDKLVQRPKRVPDYETENRGLTALAEALTTSPATILQKFSDILLEVFKADSAGVSLLSEDGKNFHWPAISGAWRPHVGGGTPRDFGPCGDVLDRNIPLLFSHWERRYPYLLEATPLAEEGLLVPFYVAGKVVGTIWAIAHDERRRFDAEDLRQLESFGRFASAAYQTVELHRAERRHQVTKTLMQEQSRLLAEVRESEHRVRELLNALPAAIYTTDTEGNVTFFNRAAEEMSGRTPQLGEDKWCVTWHLYQGDGAPLPHDQCPMAVAIRERRSVRGAEIIAERPDGKRIAVMPFPTPLYDASGKFAGAVNMLVDVSARKLAEQKEKLLVRELQHRSNNLLTVVQTIAQLSLRGADSLADAKTNFETRLHALVRAHRRVTQSDWSGIGLTEIVRLELEPFGARAKLEGPELLLAPRHVHDFSLAIHELTTNAVKYGALSNAAGEVSISWELLAHGRGKVLKFRWRERGGPPVAPPKRKGFGTVLLKTLDGNVDVEYAPEGLRCDFDLPLSGITGNDFL